VTAAASQAAAQGAAAGGAGAGGSQGSEVGRRGSSRGKLRAEWPRLQASRGSGQLVSFGGGHFRLSRVRYRGMGRSLHHAQSRTVRPCCSPPCVLCVPSSSDPDQQSSSQLIFHVVPQCPHACVPSVAAAACRRHQQAQGCHQVSECHTMPDACPEREQGALCAMAGLGHAATVPVCLLALGKGPSVRRMAGFASTGSGRHSCSSCCSY